MLKREWQVAFEMALWFPTFWYSHAVQFSPFMWAGPSDFFLASVIQQKWRDVPFMIRLQKIVTSVLLALFLSSSLCLLAPMKQGVMLLTDLGKVYLARKWGQLLVNSQWEMEVFYPTAHEILNHARWVNLEADISLAESWDNCSLDPYLDGSFWREFWAKVSI